MKIRKLNENKKDALKIYANINGRTRELLFDYIDTLEGFKNERNFFFDVLHSSSPVTIWDDVGDKVVINPKNYEYVNAPLKEFDMFGGGYSSRFIDFLDLLTTYYNSFLYDEKVLHLNDDEMREKDFANFQRIKKEKSNQFIDNFKTWKYAYRTKKYDWEIVDLFKVWNKIDKRNELVAIVYRPNKFDYGILDSYNPDTGDWLGYYYGYDSDRNAEDRIYDEYVDVEKIDREKYRRKENESIKTRKSNFPLKEAFEEDINTIKDVIDTIENIYFYDNKQFTQKQYYELKDILDCLRNRSLQDAEDKLYSLVHYHNKNLKKITYFKLDRCLDVITEINVESDEDNWWDEDENGFVDPDKVIDNLKNGAYDESIKTRKYNFPLKERKDNDIEQRRISLGELKRIFKGYRFI